MAHGTVQLWSTIDNIEALMHFSSTVLNTWHFIFTATHVNHVYYGGLNCIHSRFASDVYIVFP